MDRRKLTPDEKTTALGTLPGWRLDGEILKKTFKFPSFAEALGWMVSVGVFADKLDHHPDWSNSYNRVNVELTTHDTGALTTWDVELAKKMEAVAGRTVG